MDLKDQLKNLFPDHPDHPEPTDQTESENPEKKMWLQEEPIYCCYEKRRGKAVTVIKGYTGADSDFSKLAKELKKLLGVGGTWKDGQIIIQGDFRDRIMDFLRDKGFSVKRVGG